MGLIIILAFGLGMITSVVTEYIGIMISYKKFFTQRDRCDEAFRMAEESGLVERNEDGEYDRSTFDAFYERLDPMLPRKK